MKLTQRGAVIALGLAASAEFLARLMSVRTQGTYLGVSHYRMFAGVGPDILRGVIRVQLILRDGKAAPLIEPRRLMPLEAGPSQYCFSLIFRRGTSLDTRNSFCAFVIRGLDDLMPHFRGQVWPGCGYRSSEVIEMNIYACTIDLTPLSEGSPEGLVGARLIHSYRVEE